MRPLRDFLSREPAVHGFQQGYIAQRAFKVCFACIYALALPTLLFSAEGTLRIRFHGDPDLRSTQPLAVHFVPVSTEIQNPIVKTLSLDALPALDAPGPGPWQVSIASAGWWAAPAMWQTEGDRILDVWPAAPCHGRLQAGREIGIEAIPDVVAIRVISPPGGSSESVPETLVECPVEDLRWTCALPVAELDVRVHPKGFVSRYAWGYDVRRGVDNDFGTLVLRRGSAISGRVEAIDRDLEAGEATVHARAIAASIQTQAKSDRRRLLERSLAVDARGFFHFQGLEPGSYELTVEHPRYAPTRLGPVPVEADRETELRYPLTLYPPATLEAWIDPPLAPGGGRWALTLLRYDAAQPGILEELGTIAADANGRVQHEGLAAGPYRLLILDGTGRRVASEDVELSSNMGPLPITLDIVTVRGLLTLGGEPTAANLRFGGRRGAEVIETTADEDGAFETWLPRPGAWQVWVESEELALRREVRVSVPLPSSHRRKPMIEIALPDTRLSGTAVATDGTRLEKALITAMVEREVVFVRTDEEGAFAFRGLREASITLQGEVYRQGQSLISPPQQVQAVEDRPIEDISLVFEPVIELSGVVVGTAGPVVGASVVARCYDQASKLVGMILPSATTDVEGRFALRVPPASRSAEVTVMAPGYALAQTRLATIDAGESVILPVEQQHGALALDWGSSQAESSSSDLAPPADLQVFIGGARFYLSTLRQWANVNGVLPHHQGERTLQVPLMPVGSYRICWPPSSESGRASTRGTHTAAAMRRAVQDCAQGSLARGSTLRLALSPQPAASVGEDLQSSSE